MLADVRSLNLLLGKWREEVEACRPGQHGPAWCEINISAGWLQMLLQTWLSYLIEFLHKAITHESLWSSYLSKLIVDILNTIQHLPPTHIIRCRELSDLTLCPDVQRSRVGSWWVLCHMATLTGSHWRCSLLHWPAGTDRHTATSQLISRELGHGQTQASWNVDILNNLNTENFVKVRCVVSQLVCDVTGHSPRCCRGLEPSGLTGLSLYN